MMRFSSVIMFFTQLKLEIQRCFSCKKLLFGEKNISLTTGYFVA